LNIEPPVPTAGRLPQQKIFEIERAVAGRKWATANTTSDPAVSGLLTCFGSDALIQRVTVRAIEMNCLVHPTNMDRQNQLGAS
jgi:hypothetical protein